MEILGALVAKLNSLQHLPNQATSRDWTSQFEEFFDIISIVSTEPSLSSRPARLLETYVRTA
jgi:hypothetical protein